MAYRLIALDLDGTLLGPDGQIPDQHRRALKGARERGVEVTLVTARSWSSTAPIVQDLGLTAPVICFTGAATYSVTGRLEHLQPVPQAALQRILAWSDAEGLSVRLYHPDGTVVQSGGWASYRNKIGATFSPPDLERRGLSGLADETAIQVLFLGDPSVETIVGRLPDLPEVTATAYDRGTAHARIHLFDRGVSKGAALERYCAQRGIPREAVIAMGDTLPDTSMVAWAGVGVAVGDSPAELRGTADLVIPSDDPAPVTTALEQLGLLQREG